jgi:hypothetical protein
MEALLVSLLDGIPRALELATAWKGDGLPSCGQAAEATPFPPEQDPSAGFLAS